MRAWVYKVNPRRFAGSRGWYFDRYFTGRRRVPYPMGGREWIRSPQSWAHIRRVRKDDLFVCYQSDDRKIYGLTRSARSGYESLEGSAVFDSVDFRPGGLRFAFPVPVAHRTTKDVFRHIPAFTTGSRGTVHPVRADELRAIIAIATRLNPAQRTQIRRFALPGRLDSRLMKSGGRGGRRW